MEKFINQEHMKQENSMDIFRLIKEEKQLTRKQIETITGLSWGAVSNITGRLIKREFIAEQKVQGSTGPGRTPSCLEVNGRKYCTLGIDVNITKMKAQLVNLRNESLGMWESETDYSSKDALLSCIVKLLDQVISDEQGETHEILGIGVAMQGIVDAQNGVSVSLPQCPGWRNVELARILEERYKLPTWLEHDPVCILHAYGEGRTMENAILLRLDRGIGMAVMQDGKILNGTGRFEIAHTIVVPNGAPCTCSGRGCLEAYASMSGLEKHSGMEFAALVKAAGAGEQKACQSFQNMGEKLGIAVYNVRKIFHVSEIVLCGELLESRSFYMKELIRLNEGAKFSIADAGDASYGAAVIAWNQASKIMKI